MKRFHSNVGATKRTLQERPEVFQPVSVYAALYVSLRVIHHVMHIEARQFVVSDCIIAIELRAELNLIQNRALQSLSLYVRHDAGANLPLIPIKHSMHGGFSKMLESLRVNSLAALCEHRRFAALVHITERSADESFIGFDFAAVLTELGSAEGFILHRQSNPVKHEPCRLLSNLNARCDLVTTDPVLTVSNHPSRHHPLVQWDCGIFHHSADLDGKFTLGMVLRASPSAASLAKFRFIRTTSGADHPAVWPSPNSQIINAVVGVGEIDNSLLKALRFGFHGGFHEQNYSLKPWSSQVNCYPPPWSPVIIGLGGNFRSGL